MTYILYRNAIFCDTGIFYTILHHMLRFIFSQHSISIQCNIMIKGYALNKGYVLIMKCEWSRLANVFKEGTIDHHDSMKDNNVGKDKTKSHSLRRTISGYLFVWMIQAKLTRVPEGKSNLHPPTNPGLNSWSYGHGSCCWWLSNDESSHLRIPYSLWILDHDKH